MRIVSIRTLATFSLVAALAVGACKKRAYNSSKVQSIDITPTGNRSIQGGLRGTSDAPVEGFPQFKISGAYPKTPDFLTSEPPKPNMEVIKATDVAKAKEAALDWLTKMSVYVYEDMNNQDPKNMNNNFRIDAAADRISSKRWYHMPWLHSPVATVDNPGRGRDPIWGLTRELDLKGPIIKWPRVEGRIGIAQDWGLGFFNEPGGFTIGQVFPDNSDVQISKAKFPVGTVSFKILFSTATPEQVPDVEGAMEIRAMINGGGAMGKAGNGARTLTTMRFIQMDIMMRYGEGRHDWLFGEFVYSKNNRDKFWQGMSPVGVQWGVKANETIAVGDLEPNGYANPGEAPRLNGPADNPKSSCFSCHAAAQWPRPDFGRLPFAPRSIGDKFACLLHEWKGEGTPGCPSCGEDGCMKPDDAPIAPTSQILDYAQQFELALRNKSIAEKGE